jgi:uncharacterized membrane protein
MMNNRKPEAAISRSQARIAAAAEGMAKALHHIAFEPLTDDMEADAATCLQEATRIAARALAAWNALK